MGRSVRVADPDGAWVQVNEPGTCREPAIGDVLAVLLGDGAKQ
jgi:hypothetical protein